MLFTWDVIDNLEREGETNEWALEMGEQAVVIAFTSTETVASGGKSHAWDDGKVNL